MHRWETSKLNTLKLLCNVYNKRLLISWLPRRPFGSECSNNRSEESKSKLNVQVVYFYVLPSLAWIPVDNPVYLEYFLIYIPTYSQQTLRILVEVEAWSTLTNFTARLWTIQRHIKHRTGGQMINIRRYVQQYGVVPPFCFFLVSFSLGL